ncbi:class I SAM-dependent methyltransferase [Streptomyces sp. NBC_00342]|uniref:class I SAM-dependent methyltransferase n=1 Tax=Streptomyces sp. NBC_00342 TaxID=2975718 RepID=UPI002E27B7F8|nr:class I SAM-dependent methyltransferase [Streptomyces sp. NBC_00342]
MESESWLADTRTSYDTVAAGHADQVRTLLAEKPHERAALALFAELVRATCGGPVADVGSGSGLITAHLRGLGADAFGIDLSPAMIEVVGAWLDEAGFAVEAQTTLSSAESALGSILFARRRP